MQEQQRFDLIQIQGMLIQYLKGPSMACFSNSQFRKLLASLQWQRVQIIVFDAISKTLSRQDQAVLRIKCCILLHLLISSKINHETATLIKQLLEKHVTKLRKEAANLKIKDFDDYFETQVELPYIAFLNKLLLWQVMKFGRIQANFISIGFSQLNRIKEILQLKKILQHYGCYYHSHEYALNLFQACLYNIKALWVSVCIKVQDITVDSIKANQVDQSHFLFIEEAQKVQDMLIQFVYAQKFCLNLPKDLKIKQINLLKPELSDLSAKLQREKSMEMKLEVTKEKVKKATSRTMETQRIHSVSSNKPSKEKYSHKNNLDTGKQMLILQAINEMESVINFSDA